MGHIYMYHPRGRGLRLCCATTLLTYLLAYLIAPPLAHNLPCRPLVPLRVWQEKFLFTYLMPLHPLDLRARH